MKTTYLKPAFICLLLLLGGCRPVLMKIAGIKQPKEETKESVMRYALRHGMDTSNLYMIYPSYQAKALKVVQNRIPEVLFFSSSKKHIPYKAPENKCNADVNIFIDSLASGRSYTTNEQIVLDSLLNNAVRLSTSPVQSNPDYYMVVIWTVFTGRLNAHVREWEKRARAKRNVSIQVVKLNVDSNKLQHSVSH